MTKVLFRALANNSPVFELTKKLALLITKFYSIAINGINNWCCPYSFNKRHIKAYDWWNPSFPPLLNFSCFPVEKQPPITAINRLGKYR